MVNIKPHCFHLQGKKLVSIVPRPETSPNSKSEAESASPFVFKSNGSSIAKSDKKCRKVRTSQCMSGRVLLETESRVEVQGWPQVKQKLGSSGEQTAAAEASCSHLAMSGEPAAADRSCLPSLSGLQLTSFNNLSLFQVYGIDQKDLWCTQCKWKKACGRFS